MPSKGNTKGSLISPAYSIERQRQYLSSAIVCAKRMHLFFSLFFQAEHIFSIAFPRPATQDSFTCGPDIRSYRKSALRGTTQTSGRRDRERDVKVKSDFPSQPVRRRVPGDEGWSNPAGERACASWQARPVQGHRAAHAAQPSLRPAKRPGALYWNSADRLSWLCEERSRRPALSTIARIRLNAIAQSYSILRSSVICNLSADKIIIMTECWTINVKEELEKYFRYMTKYMLIKMWINMWKYTWTFQLIYYLRDLSLFHQVNHKIFV